MGEVLEKEGEGVKMPERVIEREQGGGGAREQWREVVC